MFCHCLYQPHTRHLHASLISVTVSNVAPQRLLRYFVNVDKIYSMQDYTRHIYFSILMVRGTRWHSWLKHCATNRTVEGSIPDGMTMALGSTQE